jgi:hypothetical protein
MFIVYTMDLEEMIEIERLLKTNALSQKFREYDPTLTYKERMISFFIFFTEISPNCEIYTRDYYQKRIDYHRSIGADFIVFNDTYLLDHYDDLMVFCKYKNIPILDAAFD